MFADWLEFASAFSIFLENDIYLTQQTEQVIKVPREYHGLFSVNTAEKTKVKTHVFRQREMSSTHVGTDRRTSTLLPPVMRRGPFGFSLTF